MKTSLPKVNLLCTLIILSNLFFVCKLSAQTTQTFNSSGTFTVPVGVTSVTVEAWGGGGAGGGATGNPAAGGGGAGGAYAKNTFSVTAGNSFTITVGAGGAGGTSNGQSGGASWFGSTSTLLAIGGPGGSAATSNNFSANGATAPTSGNVGGSINHYGGNGGKGTGTAGSIGGGGGASAGTGSDGNDAVGATGGIAVTGGGAGVNGSTNSADGTDNTNLGGGGAGAHAGSFTDRNGGNGGNGQVKITYTQLTYKSQLVSMSLGSSTWCAGETRNVTIQIKNIGTATWNDVGQDINVGVKWNTNGANWTDYHVRVDAQGLAPGATGTYTFSIKASNATTNPEDGGPIYSTPLAAGTNKLTFDVVYEGVSWFANNNGGVGPGNTTFASPNQTIVTGPTANAGAALATICQGGTSAALGGSVGGSATGGTWSDGGIGGTFSPNANTLNATWKPPVSYNGTATLTLTTTGGSCGAATASKNITVNGTPTANAGSALSAICQGGTSAPLGGSVGGSATGGTWTSSAGGSFSPNANTLNATWTPPVAYNGTATLTLNSTGGSPCSAASSSKTQVVTGLATVNAGADLPAFCQGGASGALGGSVGGSATGGTWTSSAGGSFSPSANSLNATWTPPANFNGTATLTLTATGGCGNPTDTKSQVVNAAPASVSASPASSTICFGSATSLVGSGTLSGTSSTTVDNFNGTPTFTATGTSSGDRSQIWQQEVSGSSVNSVATFTSPGGGSLMVSTAGSSNAFGASSVSSILTSGVINTTGFSSLSTLTFNHTYKDGASSGSGIVEVSTNGGSTWSTLTTYNSNQGGSTSFASVSINFSAYVNMTNLKIRFNFTTANQNFFSNTTSWWAIDDVTLNGVKVPLYSWTANTASGMNGLPVGAGTPSASNANISVNPKVTTSYTLTATNPATNCMASGTPVVVNVNPAPTLIAPADATLNTSDDGTGNCSTVYNWVHPSVNTACPTVLTVAYTAGAQVPATLPAGGTVTAGASASATFYTGTTIVTYTATDQNNNVATTSFKVTVTDDELPVITCNADVIVNNTTDQCNATVMLTPPVTSDNCGVASVTNNHPSNVYPTGTTNVTWTVKDNSNNVQTCVQKVTVNDTQLPTITCNADVSVNNDLGICGAAVNLTAPATNDNCGVASVTNDHSSSNIFPVGVTIVKWTVTDNSGNAATCNQTVTVTDNEKPVITCPASITTVTDAAVSYATITLEQPVVTDNCGVASVINNHPSAQFLIGTTLVTWTATDIHGNYNTCLQTIVVNDTIQPSIANNPPININNNSGDCSGSTNVAYPYASDNSGHVTVTSDFAGLSTASVDPDPEMPLVVNSVNFPVGPTTIVWTATDPSANTSWSLQSVAVTDNEKPTIVCPGDISQVNDPGNCSAVITLATPVTSDNCGVASVTNDHPSNVFSVGETMVTWTVTDIHGNMNTCTQKVTVTDTEIPTIVCAGDVSMNNDIGKCFATITLTIPATGDNCGIASITNDHPSSIFNEGVTNVTWTVTDIHGNINTCAQKVTVTDNEIPVITASADITQTADAGNCGAIVTITNATATDNCGVGAATGTRNDGLALSDPYPVGPTTINWNVTDIHGNAAIQVSQTVTVTDNELPVITASPDINVNNDAGVCGASVNIVDATATDNCGVAALIGTRSDGLALNAAYPVGTTTITWTATDIHGNAALDVVQNVTVTDSELPVITASANINQTADSAVCGALINVSVATATDNCGVGATHGVRNDGLSLSDAYPVGTTTITWTVTDIHGNAGIPVSQTVTVTDDEVPVITASPDINVNNDAGQCGAGVSIVNATAADNCGVDAPTGTRNDGLSLSDPYPVGTTIITWTATDIHGNNAVEVTQNINVTDNEIPVITESPDISVTNDAGVCGASVNIVNATAADNCGGGVATGTRSDGLALNASYPVGTTIITWNFTDIHGNDAIAVTQFVNVNDNEIPVITASPNITVTNDEGQCGAVVTIVPATATDNCSVEDPVIGTRNDALALTEPYPVGTTTITWNVSDIHGNAAIPVTQTVTVTDNELPVITTNDDKNVSNDVGICSAAVNVSATATDNCGVDAPTGVRSDALALTAPYPVGTTTITWNVTDIHGNAAIPVIQTVTVTDNELPVTTTNGDKSANNDAGVCSAAITVSATAADNCGVYAPTGVRSDALALTAPYPVGTTTITWNVTDIHGNAAVAVVQTVVVTDNELPVITANGDKNVNNDAGLCSAAVPVSATAADNCGVDAPTGVRSDALALTDPYPVGTTTITWNATDIHGNAAIPVTQTVTVTDNELPVITTNGDKNVNNDVEVCSAVVTVSASAADNCGVGTPSGVRSDALALTAPYPVGITTITWNATDIHGNAAILVIQTVTVTDNELPVITTNGNKNLNNDAGVCSAAVTVSATAADNCGVGTPSGVRSDALALTAPYPVGTTTITWNATDIHGNAAVAAIQTVTITDNEKPTITGTPVNIMKSNDLNVCGAVATWIAPVPHDNCAIQSFTSNHVSGEVFPKGTTTVTYIATDIHGNVITSSFTVTVNDTQAPVITCSPNIVLPACVSTASWATPLATDNCPGVIVTQTGGPASGSTFANGTTTTITYKATDASGNFTNCSFTVTRVSALTATVTPNPLNQHIYFGYSGDQTSVIKVSPTGGTAPYTIKISMDRLILCNYINAAGDEVWTSTSSGGIRKDTNAVCGVAFLAGNTRTVNTGIGTGGYLQVSATLFDSALITTYITDANGCIYIRKDSIFAEDVRCFAGNSNNTKIQVCHQTGSAKNPCVSICIDPSALADHLAHGDALGACPKTGCGNSYNNTSPVYVQTLNPDADKLKVKVMPNPTERGIPFNLTVTGKANEEIEFRVLNAVGKEVYNGRGAANASYKFGANFITGIYFVEVIQGGHHQIVKIVKQ